MTRDMRRPPARNSPHSRKRTENKLVRSLLGRALAIAVFVTCAALTALEAAETAPKKPVFKPTLTLKAESITFDRAKGDILLEGKVHVVRTTADQVLTVDCDKMTARMTKGRMTSVLATSNVKVSTKNLNATAFKADFDFEKNIIKLYGTKGKPASMTTPEMTSTGPTIILYVEDEKVKMPDGGTTIVHLDPAKKSEKKKDEGKE